MNFPSSNSWHASTNPEVKSGIATFTVVNKSVTVTLDSFASFQAMCDLIAEAHRLGFNDAKAIANSAVSDAFNRHETLFYPF